MMCRKSVVACNKGKYTKTSTDVLHKVFSPAVYNRWTGHTGLDWWTGQVDCKLN